MNSSTNDLNDATRGASTPAISFKYEGGPTKEEMAAVEKAGFGMGTLMVTIHEESDARDQRDAAIEAAVSTIKVVEQSISTEKKLRQKLDEANASFHKERQEITEIRLAHAKEVGELKKKIAALESENARLARLSPGKTGKTVKTKKRPKVRS